MRPVYRDEGSVEGTVQPHEREADGFINIWDDVQERRISCVGTPEQVKELITTYMGARVAIYGMMLIPFGFDDELIVEIDTFEPLPTKPLNHEKVRGILADENNRGDGVVSIKTRVLELYREFIESKTFRIFPGDLFRYGRYADTDYVNQERLEAEASAKEKKLAWQAALDIVSLEEEINNPRSSNG